MSELPTREQFTEHLNTKFRAEISAEQSVEMELTEVTELRETAHQTTFVLIFTAPGDTPPDQRLYAIQHDALGALDLFLVPVTLDKRGLRFEAVFNNVIKAEYD